MIITDSFMLKKMEKALRLGGDLYRLEDIGVELQQGIMQGHVENDTWAITRVHDYPRKRVVDIVFVVGNLEGSLLLEKKISAWAKDMGATTLTASGRYGWWKFRVPDWVKIGTLYSKDL
jgi:hypothetical protein